MSGDELYKGFQQPYLRHQGSCRNTKTVIAISQAQCKTSILLAKFKTFSGMLVTIPIIASTTMLGHNVIALVAKIHILDAEPYKAN